jgi:hypothetical protein
MFNFYSKLIILQNIGCDLKEKISILKEKYCPNLKCIEKYFSYGLS